MPACFRRSRRGALVALALFLFAVWDLSFRLDTSPEPQEFDSSDDLPGRVFIASNHWNSGSILRSHWCDAVVGLVTKLGPENVYFSLYESGSWDDTKEVLRELDRRLGELGVARSIILNETTHADELAQPPGEGWVMTKDGKEELRRIPYLSKLRNIVLEPLQWPEVNNDTNSFDKILFLNDVIFTPDDAIRLMQTRSGHYAAVCALDFAIPHQFYDTFALLDSVGRPVASTGYPYFAAGQSQRSLLRGGPISVKSCWNGMVSFNPEPFLPPRSLNFRGIPDDLALHHLEGSECCLIHYDNPLSSDHGVFVNPQVRVGYNQPAYEASKSWPLPRDTMFGWLKGMLIGSPSRDKKEIAMRLSKWGGREIGEDCLIDEMQVLVKNGWKHV